MALLQFTGSWSWKMQLLTAVILFSLSVGNSAPLGFSYHRSHAKTQGKQYHIWQIARNRF